MKKLLIILTIMPILNHAQYTYVPDNNFEQHLIDEGHDDVLDDYVITENINNITILFLPSLGISNLTGIEDFTSLTGLWCYNNNLIELNVTQNTNLTVLSCEQNEINELDVTQNTELSTLQSDMNQFTELDLSQNEQLEWLGCDNNFLTELDLSQNLNLVSVSCQWNTMTDLIFSENIYSFLEQLHCPYNNFYELDVTKLVALKELSFQGNQLDEIDLTQNTMLEYLRCEENQLIELDVTPNTLLTDLIVSYNPLTEIDLTQNPDLEMLDIHNNSLTELKTSQNQNLWWIRCNDNQLTCLDVSGSPLLEVLRCYNNQLTQLNVSQNEILEMFICHNNELECIQAFDLNYSNTQDQIIIPGTPPGNEQFFFWNKDNNAEWSLDCNYEYESCEFENETDCSENTTSILINSSFENGSFSCWDSNGSTIILENEYDDDFSIQVIGNYYVQQTFNPIPVSSLSNATVMVYRLEESPMAVWWDYSNGTSGSTFFNALNPGWNLVDILSELDQNLELITITFWGYSGAGPEEDVTIFDAFNFCSDVENYEPLCSTIFGCTDPVSCNYNPTATLDDGSCFYCSSREFYDGDYMDVDSEFNSARGVTISFWVNDDDYFNNPTDFSTYIDFGSIDNYRYMVRNRSGKIEAFFEGDGIPEDPMGVGASVDWSYPFASTAGTLPTPFDQTYTNPVGGDFDSGWHQITVVYCATGVRVYIDGEIEAQGVTSVFFDEFNLESQDTKRIGLNQFGEDPADAMIDEVRLWNRALSEYEIEQRYLNADPLILDITNELGQTDGAGGTLVSYWRMDCESPFLNEITNVMGTNYGTIYNEQFGGYNTCDAYVYDYTCVSDCNSCDPPEGCMDGGNTEDGDGIEACNYDPLAVVSVPQNCFYVPDYCPGLEQEYYDCECKCINDTDLDEVCDEEDNCVGVYNPNQDDLNGDGTGDDCDGIGLEQYFVDKKKLIKITDVLGREIQKETKETILIYWYNTGEVKMKYKL